MRRVALVRRERNRESGARSCAAREARAGGRKRRAGGAGAPRGERHDVAWIIARPEGRHRRVHGDEARHPSAHRRRRLDANQARDTEMRRRPPAPTSQHERRPRVSISVSCSACLSPAPVAPRSLAPRTRGERRRADSVVTGIASGPGHCRRIEDHDTTAPGRRRVFREVLSRHDAGGNEALREDAGHRRSSGGFTVGAPREVAHRGWDRGRPRYRPSRRGRTRRGRPRSRRCAAVRCGRRRPDAGLADGVVAQIRPRARRSRPRLGRDPRRPRARVRRGRRVRRSLDPTDDAKRPARSDAPPLRGSCRTSLWCSRWRRRRRRRRLGTTTPPRGARRRLGDVRSSPSRPLARRRAAAGARALARVARSPGGARGAPAAAAAARVAARCARARPRARQTRGRRRCGCRGESRNVGVGGSSDVSHRSVRWGAQRIGERRSARGVGRRAERIHRDERRSRMRRIVLDESFRRRVRSRGWVRRRCAGRGEGIHTGRVFDATIRSGSSASSPVGRVPSHSRPVYSFAAASFLVSS